MKWKLGKGSAAGIVVRGSSEDTLDILQYLRYGQCNLQLLPSIIVTLFLSHNLFQYCSHRHRQMLGSLRASPTTRTSLLRPFAAPTTHPYTLLYDTCTASMPSHGAKTACKTFAAAQADGQPLAQATLRAINSCSRQTIEVCSLPLPVYN